MLADLLKAWPGQLEFSTGAINYTAWHTADLLLACVRKSGVTLHGYLHPAFDSADVVVFVGDEHYFTGIENLDYWLAALCLPGQGCIELQTLEARILNA